MCNKASNTSRHTILNMSNKIFLTTDMIYITQLMIYYNNRNLSVCLKASFVCDVYNDDCCVAAAPFRLTPWHEIDSKF